MVSDINGINSPKAGGSLANGLGDARSVNSQNEQTQNSTQVSAPASQEDVVRLSAEASGLQSLESSLAQSSAVDETRVEAIKQAIQKGDYQINPDQIAQKLIDADTNY